MEIHGSGMTNLMITNDEINDIMNIVKDSGVLL